MLNLFLFKSPLAGNAHDYLTMTNLQVIRNVDCQAKQSQPDQRLPWTKMCAVGEGPCTVRYSSLEGLSMLSIWNGLQHGGCIAW